MPRLVAPLIFFLLFFVFLRPITKARPLLVDRLTLSHPSPLLSPRVTWDLVMMIPSSKRSRRPYLRRSRDDPCLPSVSNDRDRTRTLSSPPSPNCSLFFHVPALRVRWSFAGTFSSVRAILNEYRFRDSLLLLSLGLYFSIRLLFPRNEISSLKNKNWIFSNIWHV